MIDLGSLAIAVGQVIEIEAPPGAVFSQVRMEIIRVEDDQLFLKSAWFETDGRIVESSGSLPIRTTTEQGERGNSE